MPSNNSLTEAKIIDFRMGADGKGQLVEVGLGDFVSGYIEKPITSQRAKDVLTSFVENTGPYNVEKSTTYALEDLAYLVGQAGSNKTSVVLKFIEAEGLDDAAGSLVEMVTNLSYKGQVISNPDQLGDVVDSLFKEMDEVIKGGKVLGGDEKPDLVERVRTVNFVLEQAAAQKVDGLLYSESIPNVFLDVARHLGTGSSGIAEMANAHGAKDLADANLNIGTSRVAVTGLDSQIMDKMMPDVQVMANATSAFLENMREKGVSSSAKATPTAAAAAKAASPAQARQAEVS